MWLTFAPIPNYTAVFYGISLDQVDWFSISFFVVSLLIGFVAIATLDIFGLRVSVSDVYSMDLVHWACSLGLQSMSYTK